MRERRFEGEIGEDMVRGASTRYIPRTRVAPKKESFPLWNILVYLIVGALVLGVAKHFWKLLSPYIGG